MEAKQYVTKQPMNDWRKWRNQKIPRDKWQQKQDNPKPKVLSKNGSKKVAYCNTVLPQETRKITNKQPYITLKATRERINKTWC